MPQLTKSDEYSFIILEKIQEIFEEGRITKEELSEGSNGTDFIHAVSNIVPCRIYEQLTQSGSTLIDFNHIANKLCFQYSRLVDEVIEKEQ